MYRFTNSWPTQVAWIQLLLNLNLLRCKFLQQRGQSGAVCVCNVYEGDAVCNVSRLDALTPGEWVPVALDIFHCYFLKWKEMRLIFILDGYLKLLVSFIIWILICSVLANVGSQNLNFSLELPYPVNGQSQDGKCDDQAECKEANSNQDIIGIFWNAILNAIFKRHNTFILFTSLLAFQSS